MILRQSLRGLLRQPFAAGIAPGILPEYQLGSLTYIKEVYIMLKESFVDSNVPIHTTGLTL